MIGFENAQPSLIKQVNETQIKQETKSPKDTFINIKQINAGLLNVGYLFPVITVPAITLEGDAKWGTTSRPRFLRK